MPRLKMYDHWTVRTKSLDLKYRAQDSKDTPPSLLVRVAATHAGTVNGNYRFYRPDRMQDGVASWTPKSGFKRPILLEHNEHGDVLGRVVEARYVDESYKFVNDYPSIKDSLFYRTDSRKTGLFETVDWIVENLLDLDDYSGLGFIELGLSVTNPAAIEKALREEYLTVSVGLSTDSAICSICHQDWAEDDRCEHKLGDTVDGKPVFLITGGLEYDEVSFVNFPADPFAGVISKQVLTDAVSRQFFLGTLPSKQNQELRALALTDSLYDRDIRIQSEESMNKITTLDGLVAEGGISSLRQEIRSEGLTQDRVTEISDLLSQWKPEKDEDKKSLNSLRSTLSTAKRRLKKAADAQVETAADTEIQAAIQTDNHTDCGCGGAEADCECEPPTLDAIDEADRAFFEDSEGIYAELEAEIDAAVEAGELQDSAKDAKLSSEKRKSLKSSTFCGPNRSFPVPDCAHVTAARRLIGRAKVGSSTKEKILSCVSRKAKALGCGSSKDGIGGQAETTDTRIVKLLKDAKFQDENQKIARLVQQLDEAYNAAPDADKDLTRNLVWALLDDWGADGRMSYYLTQLLGEEVVVDFKAGLEAKGFALVDKAEAAQAAEIKTSVETLEKEVTELDSQVTDLETKLNAKSVAAQALLNAHKKSLASQIVMYRVLKGEDAYKNLDQEGIQAAITKLATRHIEFLKDTVADILSLLKWSESAPAAGQATEPGQVDNPNPPVLGSDSVQEDPAPSDSGVPLSKILGRKAASIRRAEKDYLALK